MAQSKDPAADLNSQTGQQKKRTSAIRIASVVGIIANGILGVLKLVFGVLAGSFALISDGVDSMTDVLTSGITLFTAGISSQPPDMKHPYGHGRAETIATKLLSFIIFFAGGQLIVSSVQRLIRAEDMVVPSKAALYIALVSIAGKILLSVYKRRVGERYCSSMLIADAKNMKNDVLISASVFAGIFFTLMLEIPIIDTLIAIAVGCYILISALGIFSETTLELMDGISDKDLYRSVFEAANSIDAAMNPHKTRIRKLNNRYIIDMDIEVDGNCTVKQGHDIAMDVEQRIRTEIPEVYDVQVHVEPEGNVETQETFGVTEDLLK